MSTMPTQNVGSAWPSAATVFAAVSTSVPLGAAAMGRRRRNGSPVAPAWTKTASERSSSVASDWTSRTARKRRIDRSGSEPREQRAPDAFRKEEDESHEDRPDHERPGLGEDREAVLEDEERRGADEGAEEVAGAAEQCHDDDLPRGRPGERLDR